MTTMINSVVLILPAAHRQRGNEIAVLLGYDVAPGNTYSTPLSATGQEPATHFGTHTVAQAEFLALLDGLAQGQIPPALASYTDTLQALRSRVALGVPNGDENIAAALTENGLQTILPATSLIV